MADPIADMLQALKADPQGQPLPTYQYKYPMPDDVAFARANDAAYGTPAAGIDTPGFKIGNTSFPAVINFANDSKQNLSGHSIKQEPTQDIKDKMYAAYLASLKSPVSALGYEPQNTFSTWPTGNNAATVGGVYSGNTNESWFDPRNPAALAHENTHRGFNRLYANTPRITPPDYDNMPSDPRKMAEHLNRTQRPNPDYYALPQSYKEEEYFVRALQNKNFGDAELIDTANKYHTTPERIMADTGQAQDELSAGRLMNYTQAARLKKLEDLATQLFAKRNHVMGPR